MQKEKEETVNAPFRGIAEGKLTSVPIPESECSELNTMTPLKKCEKHKGTIMLSEQTLLIVLPAILSNPEVFVYKVERCDVNGWHIYWKAL